MWTTKPERTLSIAFSQTIPAFVLTQTSKRPYRLLQVDIFKLFAAQCAKRVVYPGATACVVL